MAAAPRWKVKDGNGQYVAAFKKLQDAVVFLSVAYPYPTCGTISYDSTTAKPFFVASKALSELDGYDAMYDAAAEAFLEMYPWATEVPEQK